MLKLLNNEKDRLRDGELCLSQAQAGCICILRFCSGATTQGVTRRRTTSLILSVCHTSFYLLSATICVPQQVEASVTNI